MKLRRERIGYRIAGYVMAVFAASMAMGVITLVRSVATDSVADFGDQSLLKVLAQLAGLLVVTYFLVFFLALFIGIYSVVPAFMLILASELMGIRSRIYYATAGMISALVDTSYTSSPCRYGMLRIR